MEPPRLVETVCLARNLVSEVDEHMLCNPR